MSQSQQLADKQSTRVVVLGSGYAGIHAVRQLIKGAHEGEAEVILLSDTDHLLYVTMLYEVVAGNLAPSSIRQSVRTMMSESKLAFMQGRVKSVDLDEQLIEYMPADVSPEESSQNQPCSLSYDYLISAIGSETEFFGTPGALEHAYPVKTLSDATRLKNKLINLFKQAALLDDETKQRELLSVVVVGGGPTGVTLAAKIADLFNNELAAAFPRLVCLAQVTILEANDRVLGKLGSWFSEKAMQALTAKRRVQVRTSERATEVRADGVVCDDDFIASRCVIWTAGVRAREFAITARKPVKIDNRSRRVYVTEQLHMENYENVFVAGDQSWVERPHHGPYPLRAQFAVRQGQQAARNVLHHLRGSRMESFSWADKGVVVSLGEGYTLAGVGGFHFSGWFATVAYKAIYLLSTVGMRAKLRAILEWGMNLFLPRDVSEL